MMFVRNGRPISIPGKNYQQWHRDASKQLMGVGAVQVPVSIRLTFFPKTKRAADLTNKAESVMDLLVDNGVLPDDNWLCVPTVLLVFGEVDKLNPRVEIQIQELIKAA